MKQKYEYKFVKMGEGWFGVKCTAHREYQQIVQYHARDGWRLVQVFAPPMGYDSPAMYYDLIFEREMEH